MRAHRDKHAPDLVAHALASLVDGHGPVKRHNVDSSLSHALDQGTRLGDVDDNRSLQKRAE